MLPLSRRTISRRIILNSWTPILHIMLNISYGNFRVPSFHFLELACGGQTLVVWIEEQSFWMFPKHNLSVHPDGPNPPDAGGEEIHEIQAGKRKISEGPSGCRCEIGQRMAVKQKSVYCILLFTACIAASQRGCWDVRGKLCPEVWTSAREGGTVYSIYDFFSNSINLTDISP